MTTLILQTAAMLLCAYFLGAWIACLVRRTFFADAEQLAPVAIAPEAQRAAVTASDTGQRVSPPLRRPDPKPIALETIERAAPHAAADAASRFEQVLTTAPRPAPVPTPPAPPVNRTAPAAPVVPAPIMPPAAPVAPVAARPSAPTPSAAAANAQTSTSRTAATGSAPAAPATIQPRQVLPAASSGAGPSAVAAPIAVAMPAAEDLTRIRGIDADLQRRLLRLGVSRYRDIAGWLPADIERISRELGFAGRIEQENWIEQAQILARGGETAYARRKEMGQIATASPSANEGQARPIVVPAASPPAVAAASSPATVSATPPARQSQPIAPAQVAASATIANAPEVASRAAFAHQPKPVQPAAAPAQPAAPASNSGLAAAAAAAAAAGVSAAAADVGRDNLQRISGINAEVERLLNVQGFSRYGQIAAWSPADAGRIDRLLGQEGRVARESWVEQAAILARGGDTAFARQFDQRGSTRPAPSSDAPRPSRLADAIRDTAVKATGETAAVAAPQPPNSMSGLRSVRSEAYLPQGGTAAGRDDLKRIRGVGVLIEKKLNSMGVTTYAQVANWSAADIDRVSQVLDFKGRIERENWVEQARILSAGGQTEFSRRVDRGDIETGRSS